MAGENGQPRPDVHEPFETVKVLMGGLIDYAGLFPPAKLDMTASVANYAKYLGSPEAWMLGRFILPVSRLEEFRAAAGQLLPRTLKEEAEMWEQPWLISAIIDGDLERDIDAVFAFNHRHTQEANGLAIIDAVEVKVPAAGEGKGLAGAEFIDHAIESMPEELFAFFEIPVLPATVNGAPKLPDIRGMIAALAGAEAAAKIRTGGVTPEAFPAPERIAEVLVQCAQADVPFKATAGLHHAIRAHYPLTYEPNCPRGVMHGFLNLFLAAAFVRTHRFDTPALVGLLEETDPRAIRFSPTLVSWHEWALSDPQLAQARETFALSYGSCSFNEPVEELQRLGLLPGA